MLELKKSLQAWGTVAFAEVLKRELAQQAAELPLQQALARSNYVAETPVTVMVNGKEDAGKKIRVTVGIFYSGVIAGCSCADDPTPDSELTEFCELSLEIDKDTAESTVTLLER
jgi:hypothetical protein